MVVLYKLDIRVSVHRWPTRCNYFGLFIYS